MWWQTTRSTPMDPGTSSSPPKSYWTIFASCYRPIGMATEPRQRRAKPRGGALSVSEPVCTTARCRTSPTDVVANDEKYADGSRNRFVAAELVLDTRRVLLPPDWTGARTQTTT